MLALFSASPALRVPPPVMRVQFEAYKLSGIDAVVSGNSPGWKSSDAEGGAGKPRGTVVRQANGVVVPTVAAESAPEAAAVSSDAVVDVSVKLTGIDAIVSGNSAGWSASDLEGGAGKPRGTFVRNANGVVVPPTGAVPSSGAFVRSTVDNWPSLTGIDATVSGNSPGWHVSDGAGNPSGTVIRQSNGIVVD